MKWYNNKRWWKILLTKFRHPAFFHTTKVSTKSADDIFKYLITNKDRLEFEFEFNCIHTCFINKLEIWTSNRYYADMIHMKNFIKNLN